VSKTRRILAMGTVIGGLTAVNAWAQVPASPTFTKNIAAIFQDKCEACHRPDSIAPMSFITYEESRPWARSIRDRVMTRQMPPWHVSKTVGIQHFKNDISLRDDEIAGDDRRGHTDALVNQPS